MVLLLGRVLGCFATEHLVDTSAESVRVSVAVLGWLHSSAAGKLVYEATAGKLVYKATAGKLGYWATAGKLVYYATAGKLVY